MKAGRVLAGLIVLAATALPASADNKLVVYIECTHESKPVSQGTGVVVSPEGHVLTARHVVPEGYTCRGALESRTNPLRGLIRPVQDRNLDEAIDGKLLRFIPNDGETFAFASFCPIEADTVAKDLVVKGFHRGSIAFPSATAGVLSTHISNDVGIVETDAMTISGKSGGPVFLKDTTSIIGVVAGAKFDPSGLPAYFGVLSADAVAFAYRIMQRGDTCKPASDAVANSVSEMPAPIEVAATPVVDAPQPAAVDPIIDEEKAQLYFYQALDFFDDDEFEKAKQLYDLAIQHDPSNAEYYSERGYTLLVLDDLKLAKADFEQAIALDPEFADAYANRAELYEVEGAWDKALDDYNILLDLEPKNEEAYVWRAHAHRELGNWQDALSDFNSAIEIDVRAKDAHAFRGVVYAQLGQFEKALSDYDTAIGLDPQNEEIFADRGLTYLEMGQYEKALDDFDMALSINGSHQRALIGRTDTCSFLSSC